MLAGLEARWWHGMACCSRLTLFAPCSPLGGAGGVGRGLFRAATAITMPRHETIAAVGFTPHGMVIENGNRVGLAVGLLGSN